MDKMANNNAILRGGAAAEMSLDELFGAVEQEWQDQALCAQTDPEAFFPEKGGSTREAKRICQACAVTIVLAHSDLKPEPTQRLRVRLPIFQHFNAQV